MQKRFVGEIYSTKQPIEFLHVCGLFEPSKSQQAFSISLWPFSKIMNSHLINKLKTCNETLNSIMWEKVNFVQVFYVGFKNVLCCLMVGFKNFTQRLCDEHLRKSSFVSLMRCMTITSCRIWNKIILDFRPPKFPKSVYFLTPRTSQGDLKIVKTLHTLRSPTLAAWLMLRWSPELFHNLSDRIYYEIR